MIKLEVEEYCHNCKEFEPETKVFTLGYPGMTTKVDTTICCKGAQRCKRISEFLRKEEK